VAVFNGAVFGVVVAYMYTLVVAILVSNNMGARELIKRRGIVLNSLLGIVVGTFRQVLTAGGEVASAGKAVIGCSPYSGRKTGVAALRPAHIKPPISRPGGAAALLPYDAVGGPYGVSKIVTAGTA